MKKLILLITISITGCIGLERKPLSEIKNCVIIGQYCGFDNIDGGCYHVKNLTTGIVTRIDVDIRDCKVYNVGDTIK